MRLGVTGTRYGMTDAQNAALAGLLMELEAAHGVTEFHHGDCTGVDDQAADMVGRLFKVALIVGHPPTYTSGKSELWRAYNNATHWWLPPRGYLARNREIVNGVDVVLAVPSHRSEQARGGTWYTVRVARANGKPLAIVWPNGTVSRERWDGLAPAGAGEGDTS